MRTPFLIALVLVTALLSACGGESKPKSSPPGSPDNPLVAVTPDDASAGGVNEGAAPKAAKAPSYQSLVEGQERKPRSRFTPCNLVTKAQAQAIVGLPLRDPLEAPRGPTCIYRSRNGKSFITLAIQSLEFSELKRRVRDRRQVDVSNRAAFCGTLGAPVVYVALSKRRVLSVAARCDVGRRFAITAVRRLDA